MKSAHVYLLLCVLGTVLPFVALWPLLAADGPDLPLLSQRAVTDPVAAFFSADVLVSALVLLVLIATEGGRTGVRHRWLPVVATLAVGVSLGLPLFLYMRERRLARRTA